MFYGRRMTLTDYSICLEKYFAGHFPQILMILVIHDMYYEKYIH